MPPLMLQPDPYLLQSLLLPTPNKRVQLVRLKLPMVDEPSSILIPTPSASDQGMVIELVQDSPGRVQPDIRLGSNHIVSGGSSLGEGPHDMDGFLPPEEACQSRKIILVRSHILWKTPRHTIMCYSLI